MKSWLDNGFRTWTDKAKFWFLSLGDIMKMFRIIKDSRNDKRFPEYPSSIPWDLIAPHKERADINHSQSLETLHRRGGLDIVELYAVLSNKSFRDLASEGFDFIKGASDELVLKSINFVNEKLNEKTST